MVLAVLNKSRFLGIGSYLPKERLSNDEIAARWSLDTSDEWIYQRTGIKYRHIISEGELTSDMAQRAADNALKDAKILEEDVGLIIVATTTADKTFPSCATIVQAKLGCKNAFAFDVQAACSGFLYAVAVADEFIKSGKVKYALVIGADAMSKIIDWQDRSTCVLFGDGAGAVVISSDSEHGILSTHLYSDGKVEILCTNGGVGTTGNSGYIYMNGQAVFKHGTEKLADVIQETLKRNNLQISDIDWLVPHQANVRIIEAVAKKIGLPLDKTVITVNQHANTSAASIPLALDSVKSRIKSKDLVLLASIGAGMTWVSVLLHY